MIGVILQESLREEQACESNLEHIKLCVNKEIEGVKSLQLRPKLSLKSQARFSCVVLQLLHFCACPEMAWSFVLAKPNSAWIGRLG